MTGEENGSSEAKDEGFINRMAARIACEIRYRDQLRAKKQIAVLQDTIARAYGTIAEYNPVTGNGVVHLSDGRKYSFEKTGGSLCPGSIVFFHLKRIERLPSKSRKL